MKGLLLRKAFRDLKQNLSRYIALALLIIFSVFIVVSVMGAALTIIDGTDVTDEDLKLEDGEFSVFVPLTEDQISEITDTGVYIEELFHTDFEMGDGSILRVFKVREDIDLLSLKEGALPSSSDELVLERRYAEDLGINTGDTITIGNRDFTVSGIGAVPDYNTVYRKLSDSVADAASFGLVFVNEEAYEDLIGSGASLMSEEYLYAYRLNGAMTSDELRSILEENTFEADAVDDEYFREYIDRMFQRRDDFRDNLDELRDGTADLSDGSSEALDGARELYDGIEEAQDSLAPLDMMVPGLAESFDPIADGAGELVDGISELNDGCEELQDGVDEFYDEANDLIDELFDEELTNLILLVPAEDNVRIDSAADDVVINYEATMFVGILLLILFSYVISVFIVHNIDKDSAVIGALYSLGVTRSDLSFSYVLVPVLVSLFSGVIGTLAALFTPLGIPNQMQDTYNYYSMPVIEPQISSFLIIYGIVLPPVTAAVVNYLVIRKKLMRTPLSLLKNEQKAVKGRNINLRRFSFIGLFKIRQMLREMRTGITVVFGLFISLLVAMLALNIYMYCARVRDQYVRYTDFEYMYTYKYPEENVPSGGFEAVAVDYEKSIYGYTFDVTLLGLTSDNPFFRLEELPEDENRVIVSAAFANKYKLKEGDVFTLKSKDDDRLFAFEVDSIVPFTASMFIFADIDNVRDMFGYDEDYYNVVFSDHDLNIEGGRLYSTLTKADITKAAGIYVDQMMTMIVTIASASVAIFIVVMYLMMKMMLDRSSFNISLIKIFGFRDGEVRRMYLDGNFYIIAAGALISIPICKLILNQIYPSFLVANVGVGIDQRFPLWVFIAVYMLIIVLYLIINRILMVRIRQMTPAEVLKNRE